MKFNIKQVTKNFRKKGIGMLSGFLEGWACGWIGEWLAGGVIVGSGSEWWWGREGWVGRMEGKGRGVGGWKREKRAGIKGPGVVAHCAPHVRVADARTFAVAPRSRCTAAGRGWRVGRCGSVDGGARWRARRPRVGGGAPVGMCGSHSRRTRVGGRPAGKGP